nr:6990_t:CDS:2 [Entrophospora candida]
MSLHISTFGIRLKNIYKVAVFIELSGEHVQVKKAIYPKDRTVFDFMIPEVEYMEKLLNLLNINGFEVLYPGPIHPNIFTLRHKSASHCTLCQETPSEQFRISDPNDHFVWGDLLDMCTSKQRYTCTEVYEAIQATIACVQMKMKTWILKHIDSISCLSIPQIKAIINHFSDHSHAEVIGAWKCDVSKTEISKRLGIPLRTIYNIIEKYNKEGTVENDKRSGRPKSLSDRDKCALVKVV